jgi:hypothetical protein
MKALLNLNSRVKATIALPAGAIVPLHVGGDYFYIYALDGALEADVNDSDVFASVEKGLIHQGVVGRSDIGTVRFRNSTGSTVNVTIVYGKGSQTVAGQTTISAADLLALTPAAATVTTDFQDITASTAFTGKKAVQVTNTGGTNITVTGAGAARTLGPGEFVSWSVLRQQDTLNTITVNAAGGSARVVWQA